MDGLLVGLQALTLIGVGVAVLLVRRHLAAYLSQKGENLATKEDIGDITRKVEEVRIAFAEQLSRIQTELETEAHATRVRIERLDARRAEVAQELHEAITSGMMESLIPRRQIRTHGQSVATSRISLPRASYMVRYLS